MFCKFLSKSGVIYILLVLSVLFVGCASDFRSSGSGHLIPNQKYLVGAGSMIYFEVQEEGTIYLVAKEERIRKAFLSRGVVKGDQMSFDIQDNRIQDALRQANLSNVDYVEMYFIAKDRQ